MTIISTAKTTKQADTGIPPLNDSIDFIKDVDWQDVRRRCRAGLNNVGLVIAIIGEKLHDVGCYLAEV